MHSSRPTGSHAHRLVYSRGLDLRDPALATPIGLGCKTSERTAGPQRAFPPVAVSGSARTRTRRRSWGSRARRPRARQPAPPQLARPRAAVCAAGEAPVLEDADDAVRRAGLNERLEQIADRCLDLLVGVDDRLALVVVEEADREREVQLAALGRVTLGALQPHRHHVQLGLRELPFDAEYELIVEIPQVVDPVGVDHQRVGQPAVLKQPLGLRARARQPRDLKPEDRADLAQAHATDQLLIPPARLRVAARDAEIAVDGQDPLRFPAQPGRLVRQPVLTLGRAEVLADLLGRGLTQIDHRQALQMLRRDLLHRAQHQRPPRALSRACSPARTPPRH